MLFGEVELRRKERKENYTRKKKEISILEIKNKLLKC
jgi:hypothetical protein